MREDASPRGRLTVDRRPSAARTRLLIVRLGSLGDLVHTLPAAAALGRAHPTAEIDWLVDRVHREFLSLVPMISTVVSLEQASARGWWQVRRILRARRYEARGTAALSAEIGWVISVVCPIFGTEL